MICRNWQNGGCQFGDACKFVHSGSTGAALQPASSTEICPYFLAGSCRFGESCRLSHQGVAGAKKGKGCGKTSWKGAFGKGGQGGGKGLHKNFTLSNKGPSMTDVPATGDKSLTGPYLGKGSELTKLWSMPEDEGHNDSIVVATLMGDRLCSGGLDARLLLWRGEMSDAGIVLKQDNEIAFQASVTAVLYDAASKWFFVGQGDGLIKAYRQDPLAESSLPGHTASTLALLMHEGVLLSGSEDCSVRAWRGDANGNFQCLATLQSPAGPVSAFSVQAQSGGLWVGGSEGITCFSLQEMRAIGAIKAAAQVIGFVSYMDCVIAAFADGVVKVFNAAGVENFSHGPVGEHNTNTAVAVMKHPRDNTALLLCGQELGYVTAYDLPEFRPRGTFTTGYEGAITAIVEMGGDGIFATCCLSGSVQLWQWERSHPGGGAQPVQHFGMPQ